MACDGRQLSWELLLDVVPDVRLSGDPVAAGCSLSDCTCRLQACICVLKGFGHQHAVVDKARRTMGTDRRKQAGDDWMTERRGQEAGGTQAHAYRRARHICMYTGTI